MKKPMLKAVLIMGLVFLLILSGCSKNDGESSGTLSSSSSGSEKIVTVGIMNKISTINPINTLDIASREVFSLLFDTLYDVDESFRDYT